MLLYPLQEAIELLSTKLAAARKSHEETIEDLEWLKEQVTVMEVNFARVHNVSGSYRFAGGYSRWCGVRREACGVVAPGLPQNVSSAMYSAISLAGETAVPLTGALLINGPLSTPSFR
jgi:hypothetical protein